MDGFQSITKNKFASAFHSQTPEDFHRRLTFLQQCVRQGAAIESVVEKKNNVIRAKNSVFGKQPICVLRIGDFFYTKVIIETVTIDYSEAPWDMNPEGFGMQPMLAKVTLNMKLIGGQSLSGPISALQNTISCNYYANTSFTNRHVYAKANETARKEAAYREKIRIKELEDEERRRQDENNDKSDSKTITKEQSNNNKTEELCQH